MKAYGGITPFIIFLR